MGNFFVILLFCYVVDYLRFPFEFTLNVQYVLDIYTLCFEFIASQK